MFFLNRYNNDRFMTAMGITCSPGFISRPYSRFSCYAKNMAVRVRIPLAELQMQIKKLTCTPLNPDFMQFEITVRFIEC